MIKKTLRGKGLKDRIYDFIDEDSVSKDYFRVDLPDKFYIGKNGFSINPTQQLLKGSAIEIDIVDVMGNYVYYEITSILTETNSRLISVYIYPDINLGDITVYITGTDKHYQTFGWSKNVGLSWKEISTEPIYERQPKVIIQEQFERNSSEIYNVGYTSKYSNNHKLSIKNQIEVPTQKVDLQDYKLPNITTSPKIINKHEYLSHSNRIIGNRSTSSLVNLTAITTENPTINYKNYSTITTDSSFFDRNMIGGWYYINLKDKVESLTANLNLPTTDQFKFYYSSSLIISSSIIDVIDDKTALIYPKFRYILADYLTFDTLDDYLPFSSSYSNQTSGSIKGDNEISYLYFQIHNLDPVVGKVNDLEILYSKRSGTTDYASLIDVPISHVDLLIDSNNYVVGRTGLEYKSFGFPTRSTDVSKSWAFSLVGNITASFDSTDKTSENGIIYVSHSRIYNNDYLALYTTSSYDFVGLQGTDYDVKFEAWNDPDLITAYQGKNGRSTIPVMDIYLSGSDVFTQDDINKTNSLKSIYGSYIGSVNSRTNFTTTISPTIDSLYKLYFIVKGGAWKIRKLKITPSQVFGYTPNIFYVKTKTPTIVAGSDFNFKIDFGNSKPLHINNFFVSGSQ